jgi:hypothetical protein
MIFLLLALVLLTLLVTYTQTTMSVEKTASETATTVGFALTVDRAAASIRYSNGTMKDIVELKASIEYIELMRHFSSPSSEHPRYAPGPQVAV